MKKYDAVIAGYICVDLIPGFNKGEEGVSLSELFRPGKLIEINGLNFLIGGVVANTGLAMKKFGMNVFLNGLVGEDLIGKIATEWLDRHHLAEGIKTTTEEGTAFSIVLAPPGIDRIFLESLGCNRIFNSNMIDFDAVSQSKLFHFGYPPLLKQFYLNDGRQLADSFSKVQKMGVATSLDFSLPDSASESGKIFWPEIMKNVLPVTDIFVPSLEEALQIMLPQKYTELQTLDDDRELLDRISINLIRFLGKSIIESGVKILLIKAGHRGAYLLTGDVSLLNKNTRLNLPEENWSFREIWCNAYHVDESKVINALGAGDTAVAAFLSAILEGYSSEFSLKLATLAGRNNLYCDNIFEELPGMPEMAQEIKSDINELICYEKKRN